MKLKKDVKFYKHILVSFDMEPPENEVNISLICCQNLTNIIGQTV